MSGFENYRQELAQLDHEILHYAAVCGVELGDAAAIERFIADARADSEDDRARQSLRGLLALRMKVETEMLELGMDPAEQALQPPAAL